MILFDSPFNPFVNGRAPYIRFKCTSSTCLTNFNGGELNIQGGFDVPNGGRIRFGGGTRGDADVNVIQFLQGETETMRIQEGGNVGIGTTSPTAKLHVIGDFIATGTKSALVETASYGKRQLNAAGEPRKLVRGLGWGTAHSGPGRCQNTSRLKEVMVARNTIIQGDCLTILRTLPDESVDSIITNPPYGIDYQSASRTDKTKRKPKIANDKAPFIWWMYDLH